MIVTRFAGTIKYLVQSRCRDIRPRRTASPASGVLCNPNRVAIPIAKATKVLCKLCRMAKCYSLYSPITMDDMTFPPILNIYHV